MIKVTIQTSRQIPEELVENYFQDLMLIYPPEIVSEVRKKGYATYVSKTPSGPVVSIMKIEQIGGEQ